MIAPLLPFGFKGMVWYQGESNTGPRGGEYGEMLSRMVTDWRAKAGRDFAFLVVLIEYYHDPSKEPVRSGRAEIREGEFHVLDLPQTAIADALDQGAARTVHPPRKIEVGRRVSLAALSVAYGQKIVASGPLYQAAKVEGNQIRITFRPSESGLVIGPTSGSDATTPLDKLSGFAIAGSDKKWVWADAMIDGNTVVVKGNGVSAPVAIRYAWSDNPPANLYNQAGLPALPFRTDTWDEKAIIQEKATSSSNEPNDQLH
jgi:sialate O-acetylesterase